MTTSMTRKTRRALLWIYGAAMVYYVLKLCWYTFFTVGFPDQNAQISYIIEMSRSPSLLPDFSAMPLYHSRTVIGGLNMMVMRPGTVNYLGHPPLYYLLMAMTGSVSFPTEGQAAVDCLRLRLCNIALSSLGVALAFRMGCTYLKKHGPVVHALFAAAVATLPELGYVGAGVNNDNLAFPAMMVFFSGLLRYREDKTDLKTYLLIGLGFLLGSLSKLTTALTMAVTLLVVLVMSVVRTRSLKLIANRYFAATLPFYLVFLVYELAVRRRFGAWHPGLEAVAPEFFVRTNYYVAPENRLSMSLLQYARHFFTGIAYSWSSVYGHNPEINALMNNGVSGIVYWVPAAAAVCEAVRQAVRRQEDRITVPVVLGFLGTLAYHFYTQWSGFVRNGYAGGNQARYYLALIVPFALVFCDRVPSLFRTEKAKKAGIVLAVLLILCWLAGDAPRLILLRGFSPAA